MEKDFFENVHEVAKLIPEGRVTSYGAIAEYLGMKRGARMVGWAMNAAHSDQSIPAHVFRFVPHFHGRRLRPHKRRRQPAARALVFILECGDGGFCFLDVHLGLLSPF